MAVTNLQHSRLVVERRLWVANRFVRKGQGIFTAVTIAILPSILLWALIVAALR